MKKFILSLLFLSIPIIPVDRKYTRTIIASIPLVVSAAMLFDCKNKQEVAAKTLVGSTLSFTMALACDPANLTSFNDHLKIDVPLTTLLVGTGILAGTSYCVLRNSK